MEYHNVNKLRKMCTLSDMKIQYKNILSCITRAENKTEIVIRAFYYIALDKWQRSDVNLVWLNSFINLMFVCLVNLPFIGCTSSV